LGTGCASCVRPGACPMAAARAPRNPAMQRPDMKPTFFDLASRLALAALLLGVAAPGAPAAPTDPPAPRDPSTKQGGDGVGGIEKTAGNKPTVPTTPSMPGGGASGPTFSETISPAPEQGWNDLGGGLPTESNTPTLAGSG